MNIRCTQLLVDLPPSAWAGFHGSGVTEESTDGVRPHRIDRGRKKAHTEMSVSDGFLPYAEPRIVMILLDVYRLVSWCVLCYLATWYVPVFSPQPSHRGTFTTKMLYLSIYLHVCLSVCHSASFFDTALFLVSLDSVFLFCSLLLCFSSNALRDEW